MSSTQSPYFVYSPSPSDFKSMPINPRWVQEGSPFARAARMSQSTDGFSSTYLWDCSPGTFDWYYAVDETFHVLGGLVILDEGLPTEQRVTTGDVVYFPAGSHARWHVVEHVFKVAFLRRPLPKRLLPTVNRLRDIKYRLCRRRNISFPNTEPIFEDSL